MQDPVSSATGTLIDDLQLNLIHRVCVGDILTRSADLYPTRPAVIDGEGTVTYRELNENANRLGHALLSQGLNQGDVVGVMARNCAEMLLSYFACAKAGLICSPVNLALRGEEIAYCLNDAEARLLIVEGSLAPSAADLPAHLPRLEKVFWTGDDPHGDIAKSAGTLNELMAGASPAEVEVVIGDRDAVQLLYTSGTTAAPKGVLTSHLAVSFTALSAALTSGLTPDAVALLNLPLFHCAMLNGMVTPVLATGGTLVLMKDFDPAAVGEVIERRRVTTTVFLPVMYEALMAHPANKQRDMSSITRAVYAMAPMPEERLKAIHNFFPNADVVLGSGQTEFTPPTCFQRPEHQWSKAASWGTATAMTRVGIMDEQGNLLPRGETGEIVYRGPQVMNGYLNLPEQTAESFKYGWFHSGDVAWIDEDGAIWFTDRKKDVIKSGGENVASIEVERCLMEHPAVTEAAVIGLPHSRWGEAVTAAVVLKDGSEITEQALLEHCRQTLSGFKVPKAIRFETEFPRTGTGKIQKHVMRRQWQDTYNNA
ncbi:long-chain-fatty-acid--CoA ligase [Proteobacteria bacterium 005FR1]|nr:long-chain-fatty-acid--CoA ligase [Proteobacteria bacterium 005FR1]